MAPTTCTVPENAITQCQLLVAAYIAPVIGGPNNSPAELKQLQADSINDFTHRERQTQIKDLTAQRGFPCRKTRRLFE